jgi:hypothetical protein
MLNPPGGRGSGRGSGSGIDRLTKGISGVFGTALTSDKDEMIRDALTSLEDPTLIDYIPENALISMIKRGKEAGDGWWTLDSSGTTQLKRDLEDWINNNSKTIAKAKERERDEIATSRLLMEMRNNLLVNSSPEAAAAYKKAMAKAKKNANGNTDSNIPITADDIRRSKEIFLESQEAANAAETDANMVDGTNLTGFNKEDDALRAEFNKNRDTRYYN